MGTSKTSHPGVRLPSEIRADGQSGRRVSRAPGHHRKPQRLNHLVSGALWLGTRVSTYLHQAYGKRGQQTQQADQPVNGMQLPFFNATPTFEAVMIVLNHTILPRPSPLEASRYTSASRFLCQSCDCGYIVRGLLSP